MHDSLRSTRYGGCARIEPMLLFFQKLRLGQSLSVETRIFHHSWALEGMVMAGPVRHVSDGAQFARSQCGDSMY